VKRISFLTADIDSGAFGRDSQGQVAPDQAMVMTGDEVKNFREVTNDVIHKFSSSFSSGFIAQSPEKMLHMVQYYEALIGMAPFPRNHCNAPMISAVITATGSVLPCFFLPTYGNVRESSVRDLLGKPQLRKTRNDVRAYSLKQCQRCVCTSTVYLRSALFDRF
jgi:hypothetical protein